MPWLNHTSREPQSQHGPMTANRPSACRAEKTLLPWGEPEVRDQTALPRDCSHFPESKEMD